MSKQRWTFFMPARDHSFIKWFSALSYAWLTPHGMILVTALFVSAGIASPGLHISAYVMTSIILSSLMTALIFSFFFVPKVSVHRKFPDAVYAGEDCVYKVIVTNRTKKRFYDIFVNEGTLPYGLYYAFDHPKFDGFIPVLEPGQSRSTTLVMRCQRRGQYTLRKLMAGSSYPLNLIRCPFQRGQREQLTVYPEFTSQINFDLPLKNIYQTGGIAISTKKGESNEFFGTREYRYGDRLKDIHWRSYAHTGKLIVKEYIDEYFVRTGMLVDTQIFNPKEILHLEKRVSIAAGLADALSHKGYLIDLLAEGNTLHEFEKGNADTYLDQLMRIFATLEGQKSINFRQLQEKFTPHLQATSSLVVILGDWDESRAEFCQFLKNSGIELRLILVEGKKLTATPTQKVSIVQSANLKEVIT